MLRTSLIVCCALLLIALPAAAQMPRAGHVVVVVEENHAYNAVIGNASMPYLNSLATQYGLATNYYANTQPGIGNYFQMAAGQLVTNDPAFSGTVSADNLARQLLVLGATWKSYAEDLPATGYAGSDRYPYQKYRNPFAYFSDVVNSSNQKPNLVPLSQLSLDLESGTLPRFSLVLPNVLNDGRDGSLSTADAWLQRTLTPLLADPQFQQDGVLFIVFDQAGSSDTRKGGGKVAAIVVSPAFSKAGYKSTTFYQHQSLLRTALALLGGGTFPGAAASAPAMSEFFAAPTGTAITKPNSLSSTGSGSSQTSPPSNGCANTANNTVVICSPTNGSSSTNTAVNVVATAYYRKGVRSMQVFVDGTNAYTVGGGTVSTNLTLAVGTHIIKVTASAGGRSFSSSVTTTVAAPTARPPVPTASFAANPLTITAGQSSTLSWSTTNATSVTLNGSAVAASGTQAVSPASTTTYTLTANGSGGTVSRNVTIIVQAPPPAPTATISANPLTIIAGQSSTLSWSTTNATTVTLNGSTVAASGTQSVSPANTTTYTLTATGAGGTSSTNVTLAVQAPPPPPPPSHSAAITWTESNPTGITSYKTYRATGTLDSNGNVIGCGSYSAIGSVAAPTMSYTDGSVAAGAGYCYAVTAVGANGESTMSPSVTAKIPTP